MISIHTFELALDTNTKNFNYLLSRAYEMAKKYNHRLGPSCKHTSFDVRIDAALASNGIMIEYHNNKYKKTIKFRVNPSEVLGGNDLNLWKPSNRNIEELIDLLNEHLGEYLDYQYEINDLKLTRVEFTVNLNVGKKKIAPYLNLMYKIGKVKKFSAKYNKLDFDNGRIKRNQSFDLEGNTNGIGFTVYDKQADLIDKKRIEKAKKAKGILRIEIRVKKRKAVRQIINDYIDERSLTTEEQIELVAKNSRNIFLSNLVDIIPFGDYYKLKDAEKIVENSGYNKKKKEKMIRLLNLIPQKKSLYLALKELNVRNPSEVLVWFASLNLSPITISKREKEDFLDNLYNYLED